MVQEEISELLTESSAWKDSLKNYRESFIQSQKKLLRIASDQLSQDGLHELERFQNQFYIQLLNIHDIKRKVKNHILRLDPANGEDGYEETSKVVHEEIKKELNALENRIEDVNLEFEDFTNKLQ